jgi:hypothetical protein
VLTVTNIATGRVLVIAVTVALLSATVTNAFCGTNADCPGSFCMNVRDGIVRFLPQRPGPLLCRWHVPSTTGKFRVLLVCQQRLNALTEPAAPTAVRL